MSEENNKKITGLKHLIECNCILPIYENKKDPVWHKFPVFSKIDENDTVEEKFVQCNNCGIIHKIIEIGKSEVTTKENLKSIKQISDIKLGMPGVFVGLLENYNCSIATWEEVEFILEEKLWGYFVILESEKEIEKGLYNGKAMIITGPTTVKIESFIRQDIIK